MKNASIFSAAVIGASAFAFSAFAQDTMPKVPGSDEVIEQNQEATRDAVADNPPAATPAAEAGDTTETIVPGSESQIQLNEAAQRDAVASGTKAETTGETAADGTLLVPGSGATMNESKAESSTTTTSDVLQDEASTDAVK